MSAKRPLLALSLVALAWGCAGAQGGGDIPDAKPKPDFGPIEDTDYPPEEDTWPPDPDTAIDDTGPGLDTGTPVDSGVDTSVTDSVDSGPACNPVINEVVVETSSAANDEFVELYNPCKSTITLVGWKLVYRAEKNLNGPDGPDSTTLSAISTLAIPAGGYLLFVNASGVFNSTTYKPDDTFGGGLAGTAGSVGLRDASGKLVDSVFWGTPAGGLHAFVETTPVPAPPITGPPGTAVARSPNGLDTNDNSKDFKAQAATPRAKNP